MPRVNAQYYIEVVSKTKKPVRSAATKRNWWVVKATSRKVGRVSLGEVIFPQYLVGRHVRFKVEIELR